MEEEEEETDFCDTSDPHDIFDTSKWMPNTRLLSCEICNQKFSNKLKIVAHWCSKHHYKLCSFCTNYAFRYDSDKIQHELQHIPFSCSVCSKCFFQICEKSVSEHYKSDHQSFLCNYCSSVIQPYDKYPEHMEKKHNILDYTTFSERNNEMYDFFEIINDGDINGPNIFFFCFMCDKKKQMSLLFGHFVFYHSISIHAFKKCLDLFHTEVVINGSVLNNNNNNNEKDTSNDIEDVGNNFKEICTVCENAFKFDEVTKDLHGVFCKGKVICSLKDCYQTFESTEELQEHMETQHSSLSCKFGCPTNQLKAMELNDHLESFHDLKECFLCTTVFSSATFKNHLQDKHNVNLIVYDQAMLKADTKLFHVEEFFPQENKQVLCNFCNYDITAEIKKFSFIDHYKNHHEISSTALLRNLAKNPIIDLVLNEKQTNFDEECLQNIIVKLSYDSLIEIDFDASKVCCIGTEHNAIEDNSNIDEFNEYDDDENKLLQPLFTCEFCKKNFGKICKLYEHLSSHGFRLMNIDACEKCKIQNSETHTNNTDNKGFNLSLVCPYDMTNHVTKNNFTDHLIFEHSEKALIGDVIIYKCHLCNFAYKTMKDIRNHFNVDHPNIIMKYCRICRYKLTPTNESDHFKLNHAEDMKSKYERYCCKVCKKEFKKQSTAKLHYLKTHKTKEPKKRPRPSFKCQNSSCNETFDNKEDRKIHQLYAHPDEKIYSCKVCSMKFTTKSSLSSHNMIHKNIINTCEFCQKTFLRRDSFKEHLLIHSDVRLKCSFCEKVFVQRSNLVRHERIHLNDRPYKCAFCDKTFSDKGACTSHEKVHTKTEHADCEICGKHFARKQKLKYHMRLHTMENVLTCECGKIFPESYSYRKHQETHINKNESTRCNFCGETFKSKKARIRHEQIEHSSNYTSEEDIKNKEEKDNCAIDFVDDCA